MDNILQAIMCIICIQNMKTHSSCCTVKYIGLIQSTLCLLVNITAVVTINWQQMALYVAQLSGKAGFMTILEKLKPYHSLDGLVSM